MAAKIGITPPTISKLKRNADRASLKE
ncbi:MAG TPA: hypothetical protein ACHBY5_04165 [Arsenophonus apicola]|nr:hypothetical protein LDL57_09745 [Arsenophonus apicola]